MPVTKVQMRSGEVPVSNKETTLLDIANDIEIVGGIDNAANLIIELCETEPDMDALDTLSVHYPVTAVRRLGFLLESFTSVTGLEKLKGSSLKRETALSVLDPQAGSSGTICKDWNIKINREVSPDI